MNDDQKECPECGGCGKESCPKCDGYGYPVGDPWDICDACGGSGDSEKDCTVCKGMGYIEVSAGTSTPPTEATAHSATVGEA